MNALGTTVEAPLNDIVVTYQDRDDDHILTCVLLDCLATNKDDGSLDAFHCRALFKPYQFRPLLKFARSNGRLLIADETGLGKTIEAAYIILDEILRNKATRIIIACPSHLKNKWRGELWNRFGLSFTVVSGSRALKSIGDREKPFKQIVSIDSIKTNIGELGSMVVPDIDLLVIDEVHNLIGRESNTRRRIAGLELSMCSKKVVGISASPVHLKEDDLFRILEVIDPGRVPFATFETEMLKTARLNQLAMELGKVAIPHPAVQTLSEEMLDIINLSERAMCIGQGGATPETLRAMVTSERWSTDYADRQVLRNALGGLSFLTPFMTRTKRREVGEERNRVIRNNMIELSEDPGCSILPSQSTTEASIYKEIDRLFVERFSHVHRRQLASSMPAILDLLYNGMDGFNYWNGNEVVAKEGASDENTKERCKVLSKRLRSLRIDSKWEAFHRAVEDLRSSGDAKKVIVFTQWLPTYRYLLGRLGDVRYTVFAASGETNEETRTRVMKRFQESSEFCVLLATDILSEGVDLQTANCIINYDLPYNPQRIEQRIGRVDRVGQKEDTIFIVNLITSGSVDDEIFDILLTRSRIFDLTVGEMPAAISEGIDETETLDAQEVVKQMNDYLNRKGIGDLEFLRGAEEALDRDIDVIFERKDGKEPFWLAHLISHYINSVFGRDRFIVDVEDGKRVLIKGLSSDDIRSLSEVASPDERYYLEHAMSSAMVGDVLPLDLIGNEGAGLFTPLVHPLIDGIIKELNARENVDGERRMTVPILQLHSNIPSIHNGRFVLVAFSYKGIVLTKNALKLVSMMSDNKVTIDIGISDLFEHLGNSEMPRCLGLVEDDERISIEEMIIDAHTRWTMEQRKKEKGLIGEWKRRIVLTDEAENLGRSEEVINPAHEPISNHFVIGIIDFNGGGAVCKNR